MMLKIEKQMMGKKFIRRELIDFIAPIQQTTTTLKCYRKRKQKRKIQNQNSQQTEKTTEKNCSGNREKVTMRTRNKWFANEIQLNGNYIVWNCEFCCVRVCFLVTNMHYF